MGQEKLKNGFKEKCAKVGGWCRRHKGFLISTGLVVVATVLGVKYTNQKPKNVEEKPEKIEESPTVTAESVNMGEGRTFVMKFFDQKTGEPYREDGPLCAECCVEDMYDMDGAYGTVECQDKPE